MSANGELPLLGPQPPLPVSSFRTSAVLPAYAAWTALLPRIARAASRGYDDCRLTASPLPIHYVLSMSAICTRMKIVLLALKDSSLKSRAVLRNEPRTVIRKRELPAFLTLIGASLICHGDSAILFDRIT
jgi:hypothetical protein